MASRFRFNEYPLPQIDGLCYDMKVRNFHPSLQHLRQWLSLVGAAVAAADLDGDGLPNDLVHVDPRADDVAVVPAPGTGERFVPFILVPAPLPFDKSTMAPMGSRIGDFNEDGYADILVYYWGRSPIIFLQSQDPPGGKPSALNATKFVPFELVEPYQIWHTSAVGQADLDGDGHFDLIIGNYNPDGSRVLDAHGSGVENMMHSMSRAFNGGRDRLFLWERIAGATAPRAPFRDVSDVLDPEIAGGWTFALGTADLDGDLLPEVYLAQDFGPDRLLHNRSSPGQLKFELLHGGRGWTTPRSLVVGFDSFSGMGVDFADINGDGWLDIFVSNLACNFGLHESNFAFLSTGDVAAMNRGVAPYRDASENLGISRSGWAWDIKLGDFDNDGFCEILQAAGFMKGTVSRWPELQELALGNDELMADPRFYHRFEPGAEAAGQDHNLFFVRSKSGRYFDMAKSIGIARASLSRGIAPADVDGDGKLDFAIANNWERSYFFRNDSPGNGSFLGLHLRLPIADEKRESVTHQNGHPAREKVGMTRPAIGAVAVVHLPDGRKLFAQMDGGNGHSGQRASALHFGLGSLDSHQPLRVDIRWRSGAGEVCESMLQLERDNWHTVVLGDKNPARGGY